MSYEIYKPVCPVCREAILIRLLAYSDAVKATLATSYRIRPGQNAWLSIRNKVENGTIVWKKKSGTSWQTVQVGGESYRFASVAVGTHEFKVTVTDPTPWVRDPIALATFEQGGYGITTDEVFFRVVVAQ